MRWKNKKEVAIPKIGYRKIVYVFCWLPFLCDDGYRVWLGQRKEIFIYKKYAFKLPISNYPNPSFEGIGWVKEQTLSVIPMNLLSEIATQDIPCPVNPASVP